MGGIILQLEVWRDEPDSVSFQRGPYHLLIHRTDLLHLCGYVGVRKDHVCYGSGWNHALLDELQVHGGITYSRQGGGLPNSNDQLWYFGFDCAHFGDYVPGIHHHLNLARGAEGLPPLDLDILSGHYRDINYVAAEVKSLYEQLKAIQKEHNKVKYKKKMMQRRWKSL